MTRSLQRVIAVLAQCAWLAACGGGGTSNPPPPPTPPAPPPPAYHLGGTVSGLPAGSRVTVVVNASTMVVTANGAFSSTETYADGTTYTTTAVAPTDRRCLVAGGSGKVAGADVTSIAVDCSRGLNWITNGPITQTALSADGRTLYAIGNFSRVGAPTGSFIPLDASTGVAQTALSTINDNVVAAIGDGHGGFYVATQGRILRSSSLGPTSRLLHLDSTGKIDTAFNAEPTGAINAMVLSGSTLYVGGSFSKIGGANRKGLAALDAGTGSALALSVDIAGGNVTTLALAGNTLYLGGRFSQVGGTARSMLAAVDIGSGAVQAWSPVPALTNNIASVQTLALSANGIYLGGYFDSVSGVARSSLAELDRTSGTVLPWNPAPGRGATVQQIVTNGSTVYVAGLFSSIGNSARNAVAALSATDGSVQPWDAGLQSPGGASTVRAIVVGASAIYLAGSFSSSHGTPQAGLAAVAPGTGQRLDFDAGQLDADAGSASVLVMDSGKLAVGGSFVLYGGLKRNGLAAFDTISGAATAWNPDPHKTSSGFAPVSTIVAIGSSLAVAGSFDTISGQARSGLALLDGQTGAVLSPDFGLDPTALINAMATDGSTLYVGGSFNALAGQPRTNLAAIDVATGALRSWAPAVPRVNALSVAGGRAYVSIAGDGSLKAFDTANGNALPWQVDARFNGNPTEVWQLVASPSAVYLVGGFDSVNGVNLPGRSAAVDPLTGTLQPWMQGGFISLSRIFLADGKIYGVLSGFTIQGVATSELATLSSTGQKQTSLLVTDGSIDSFVAGSDSFYIGGKFGLDGGPRAYLDFITR